MISLNRENMMKVERSNLKNEGDKFVFDLISNDILLSYYECSFDDDKVMDDIDNNNIQSMKDDIEINSILYHDYENQIIDLKNVIRFILHYDYTSFRECELLNIDTRNIQDSKLKKLVEFMNFDIKEYLINNLYDYNLSHDIYLDIIESENFEKLRLFTEHLKFYNESSNMYKNVYDIIKYLYKNGIKVVEEDNHIRNMIRQYNKVNDIKVVLN